MKRLAQYISPLLPTEDAVKAVITGRAGSVRTEPCVRLLHSDRSTPMTVAGAPDPTDPSNITGWVKAAMVTNNTSTDIMRSCKLTLDEIPGVYINTIADWFAVSQVYRDTAGTKLLDIPWGTFAFNWPDRAIDPAADELQITGQDATSIVRDLYFENPFAIPKNMQITAIVQAMLMADRLSPGEGGRQPATLPYAWPDANHPGMAPSGCPCPGPGFAANQISVTAAVDISTTTSLLSRDMNQLAEINNLLKAINYETLYVTSQGIVSTRPKPYYSVDLPVAEWTYLTGDPDSMILPGTTTVRVSDPTALGNVAIVVNENSKRKRPIVSIQKNYSMQSAISIPMSGREIFIPPIKNNDIPDQAAADRAALLALQKAAIAGESVEFQTALNPLHETFDALALDFYNRNGQLDVGGVQPFIETFWEADLFAMTMRHVAGKSVAI